MCLILFAIDDRPKSPLILAANRDEFLARPASGLHWWDSPNILAGKDLKAGGTWFGIDRKGRWAAVTNFRGAGSSQANARSRGELITNFLEDDRKPGEYLKHLQPRLDLYSGFNLLVAHRNEVWYFTNRTEEKSTPRKLARGIYGLSNHSLDTPWPKVTLGESKLKQLLNSNNDVNHESMFSLLKDDTRPDDSELPDTGIGIEKERLFSSMFIQSENYGTRCSTSLFIGDAEVQVAERTLETNDVKEFRFRIE